MISPRAPQGRELIDADPQIVHALPQGREAGRAIADPVFDDLRIRNLASAVVDGGLGARVELGIAIGLALVGGKR